MNLKQSKLKELVRELAAEFFSRQSNRTSLITITDVEIQSRGSKATVLFTVLPVTQEEAALNFMHRQLTDFRKYVTGHARMMRVPFFDVAIDKGEKNRQKIDTLSS